MQRCYAREEIATIFSGPKDAGMDVPYHGRGGWEAQCTLTTSFEGDLFLALLMGAIAAIVEGKYKTLSEV